MYQLSGAVARQDQTVNLTSAYTLPGGSYPARIRIDSETMLVRGGAGTSFLSVQRGVDGTAPATHAAGAIVYDDTDTDEQVGDIIARVVYAIPAEALPYLEALSTSPGIYVLQALAGKHFSRGVSGQPYAPGLAVDSGMDIYQSGRGSGTPVTYVYFDDSTKAGDQPDAGTLYTFYGEAAVNGGVGYASAYQMEFTAVALAAAGITADLSVKLGNGLGGLTMTERLRVSGADGSVYPGTDNAQKLGTASKRWSVVYAGTGTINTSDAVAKDGVSRIDSIGNPDAPALLGVARRLADHLSSYRMADAVAEKGDAARVHHGITAQDVEQAFKAEGLDPARYGVWCRDEWPETVERQERRLPRKRGERQQFETVETVTPAGEALGIRYDELYALMFAGLNARITALEAKLGG